MAEAGMQSSITYREWDFANFVIQDRVGEALHEGRAIFPIFRSMSVATTDDLETVFDRLAVRSGWHAYWMEEGVMLLDGPGVFVRARGGRNKKYCYMKFKLWAKSVEIAASAKEKILAVIGESRMSASMITLRWQTLGHNGSLSSVDLQELVEEELLDQSYPEIQEGVDRFIQRYLDSDESVLLLHGPPGTGKTTLIRAILGAISARKGSNAQVMYSGDRKTMESDQLFLEFITGDNDVFVIEDADHLLLPRTDGNEDLHRFLTIADGVAKAQGRKVIFSSNLPNLRGVDEALIRPGRCFARLHIRNLSQPEAQVVLTELCVRGGLPEKQLPIAPDLNAKKAYSLAEVYKMHRKAD